MLCARVRGRLVDGGDGCGARGSGEKDGAVVLVRRGECSFMHKALTMQASGAAAVVIFRTEDDKPIVMSDGGMHGDVSIPVVSIGATAGQELLQALQRVNETYTGPQQPENAMDTCVQKCETTVSEVHVSIDGFQLAVQADRGVAPIVRQTQRQLLEEPTAHGAAHVLIDAWTFDDLTWDALQEIGEGECARDAP
uniref:PA domain-containing protein n=1 Tax=Chrysotila carterae TaxID=13221 RepID=A0A7S4C353_CHRCT